MPDGLNDLSSGCSRSRKRKSTTASNAALQKRMRGSISLDNEAVPIELRGTDSANIEVGTNRIMDPVSVGEEGVVKKRTKRSKPVGNEGAARKKMRASVPVGDEGAVKKTGSVATENHGGVTKRKRAPSRWHFHATASM